MRNGSKGETQREGGPRLEAETAECACGFGARSIRLSFDRSTALVGCKDGSVTAVPLAPLAPGRELEPRLLVEASSERQRVGVRALCDVAEGNLLVGRDVGGVDLVRWRSTPLDAAAPLHLPCGEIRGAVSFLGRWGDERERLIVSARNSDALIVELELRETGPRLVAQERLPGVEALAGVFPMGEDDRLLVSRTGALWRHRGGHLEPASPLWVGQGCEQPSFVFDLSAIKSELGSATTHGMYLSTAEGVFLLQRGADNEVAISPIHLPGLGDLCLAISHAVRGENCYLWVSDHTGTVHLFWDRRFWEGEGGAPRWRRSGIREGRLPVLRAIASWRPPEGVEAVVGQACRNDLVSIAWYRAPRRLSKGQPPLADFLSWGTAAELRKHRGSASRTWCIEALLADEIEEAGETQEGRKGLRLFLRNPGPHLAMSVLETILDDAGGTGRAGEALTLWAYTLVGTIHRRLADPVAEDYLGVLRWLRRLERRLAEVRRDGAWEALQPRIEEVILQSRKWGLFGATLATRRNAVAAQRKLAGQGAAERSLEQLVYGSQIFSRRVNLEAGLERSMGDTLAPWDVAHLRHGDREYLAVTIQQQEIVEANRQLATLPGQIRVYRRELPDGEWRPCELPPADGPGESRPERYSRRILLEDLGGRPFLLAAPVDVGNRSEITLRFLAEPGSLFRLRVGDLLAPRSEHREESVYSLLALDPEADGGRLVVVGLEGRDGRPRLGLLRIEADGRLRPLHPASDDACSLLPSYPETKTLRRNPIWAMARVPGHRRQIVVGCGDGQICRLALDVQEDRFEIPVSGRTPVGRLSAPVWALACSRPEPRGSLRVFAGGADGTLLAFQWVRAEEASGAGDEMERPFATLWSTRERGPFSRIHAIGWPETDPHDGRALGRANAILGITRHGTAVLISDRAQVDDLREEDVHQRVSVPGERLGRFSLGSTVFGSVWLPGPEDPPPMQAVVDRETGLVARVAVATGEGAVRLVTLHYPKYTASRQERFRTLLSELFGNLGGKPYEEKGFEVPGHLLRRAEITYAAEPALTVALVRWVLSADPTDEPWDERNRILAPAGAGPAEQWLPRHLRPLAQLDRLWAQGEEPLGDAVREALASARRTKDRALFREILEVVLRRCNRQLYAEARAVEDGGALPFAQRFLEILQAIEGSRGAWLGWSDDLDSKMRIVIAKNLLDGDTLWSLARAMTLLRKAMKAGVDSRCVFDAMTGRTRQVQEFLDRGDDLLALEALRAANLALLRLCRRLDRYRRQDGLDWSAGSAENRLDWDAVQGFFEAVGDYAARSAHRNASMEEAVAHEICRAYALGMLACPPAILRLGVWMAEADLPRKLIQQVHDQLDLLADLLPMSLTPVHRELLGIIIGPRAGSVSFEQLVFQGRKETASWTVPRVGADNVGLIAVRKPFDDIVRWLHDLANRLTDDAAHLLPVLARAAHLRAGLRASERLPADSFEGGEAGRRRLWEQFRHSREFWQECLQDLERSVLGKFAGLGDAAADDDGEADEDEVRIPNIRPDAVLASHELAEWSQKWSRDLQMRRLRLQAFEPVYRLYTEALALVERAARRFREGAAVQKNVVLGVLGHGLLELLDEHVLELWEIAQAVDPKRTRERDLVDLRRNAQAEDDTRANGHEPPRGRSTAARFADYLLDRAKNAETVPSNLRSLQGLLSFSPNGAGQTRTYADFFRQFAEEERERHGKSWDLAISPAAELERSISPREQHFLRLTLGELAQNDLRYGTRQPADAATTAALFEGQARSTLGVDEGGICFALRCRVGEEEWPYVESRVPVDLQQPVSPHPDPTFPSHGTGLYLANLAAAAVGWKLRLVKQPPRSGDGVLLFKLMRHDPLE